MPKIYGAKKIYMPDFKMRIKLFHDKDNELPPRNTYEKLPAKFRFKKVDNTIVPIKKVKDNKVWLLEAKVNKE